MSRKCWSSRKLGIVSARGAQTHPALDAQHELVAHLLGGGEHVFDVRVIDHLHHAVAVAQVDEDHPAVVAATVHPAAKFYCLVYMGGTQVAAKMAAHGNQVSTTG